MPNYHVTGIIRYIDSNEQHKTIQVAVITNAWGEQEAATTALESVTLGYGYYDPCWIDQPTVTKFPGIPAQYGLQVLSGNVGGILLRTLDAYNNESNSILITPSILKQLVKDLSFERYLEQWEKQTRQLSVDKQNKSLSEKYTTAEAALLVGLPIREVQECMRSWHPYYSKRGHFWEVSKHDIKQLKNIRRRRDKQRNGETS